MTERTVPASSNATSNPVRARLPVVRDWVVGSTRTVTAPPPTLPASRQRDWPNPRGAKPNQPLSFTLGIIQYVIIPPQGPSETLKNLSGRMRYLKNEVGRVRYLKKL